MTQFFDAGKLADDLHALVSDAEALLKAKSELAHLSRVTAMGELVASIAHEVNQPIGAIVTNANAAQRWLKQQPPNPREVDEALDRIVQDANRAGAVTAGPRTSGHRDRCVR